MTSSTIESLLQIAAPARAAEPPRRAETPPFGPALNEALAPEKTPAPAAASAPLQAAAPPQAAETGDERLPEDRYEEATGVLAEAAEETDDENAPTEEAEAATDEIVLSEAAASWTFKTVAEGRLLVAKPDGEKLLDVQDAGDQPAGDAAASKPQADEAAGAKANEAETKGAALQGEVIEKIEADGEVPAAIKPRGGGRRESRDSGPNDSRETTPRLQDSARAKESLQPQPVDGENDLPFEGNADNPAVVEQSGGVEVKTDKPAEARSAKDDRADATKDVAPQRPEILAPVDMPTLSAENDAKPQAALDDAAVKPASEASANSGEARAATALDRLGASRSIQPSAPGGGDSEAGAPVDRTRFIQRVEGALRRAHERDGRVQVRLSPPELGNLRIEIALTNGVLTAKLEAETPAARNLLMDNLPALRERLAQQDIRVEKFDVDVRRDGAGGGTGSGGDHSAGPRGGPRGYEAERQPCPAGGVAFNSTRRGASGGRENVRLEFGRSRVM